MALIPMEYVGGVQTGTVTGGSGVTIAASVTLEKADDVKKAFFAFTTTAQKSYGDTIATMSQGFEAKGTNYIRAHKSDYSTVCTLVCAAGSRELKLNNSTLPSGTYYVDSVII